MSERDAGENTRAQDIWEYFENYFFQIPLKIMELLTSKKVL